jgi:hypothetical protein
MTKVQTKLVKAYDQLTTEQGRINVHEVVQEAMRGINYTWATYQRYSQALMNLLGTEFQPAPAHQQEQGIDLEWFNTVLVKVGA